MVDKLLGFPVKYSRAIPEGHVMLAGYRQGGPGTTDPMEQYGAVLIPSGHIVEFVVRDGKIVVR